MKHWPAPGAAPPLRRSALVALTILGLHFGAGGLALAPRAARAADLSTHHAATTRGGVWPVPASVQSAPRITPTPDPRERPQTPCYQCPPARSNR
jgi:hypothetical protein